MSMFWHLTPKTDKHKHPGAITPNWYTICAFLWVSSSPNWLYLICTEWCMYIISVHVSLRYLHVWVYLFGTPWAFWINMLVVWALPFAIFQVPLEGFSALQGISGSQKFQIHKAYGSPEHLPSAHTWYFFNFFFVLHLWDAYVDNLWSLFIL